MKYLEYLFLKLGNPVKKYIIQNFVYHTLIKNIMGSEGALLLQIYVYPNIHPFIYLVHLKMDFFLENSLIFFILKILLLITSLAVIMNMSILVW